MSTDYAKDTQPTPRRASAVPCDELHIDHPPRGIKMWRDFDGATVINVRMFSRGAFGALLTTLFWNGITSIFVGEAISLTVAKFGIDFKFLDGDWGGSPPPLWFFWSFLTPFIAIGLYMVYWTVFHFWGRLEIRLRANEGSFFKGFGSLGRTQRFSSQSVKSMGMNKSSYEINDEPVYNLAIKMNNGRIIKFPQLGTMRETWLAFALEKILGLKSREAPNPPNYHA